MLSIIYYYYFCTFLYKSFIPDLYKNVVLHLQTIGPNVHWTLTRHAILFLSISDWSLDDLNVILWPSWLSTNDTRHSAFLLDVGLGHLGHMEFSVDDAIAIIHIRVKLLEQQIKHFRKEIIKINAHIKLILLGIRKLQGFDDKV